MNSTMERRLPLSPIQITHLLLSAESSGHGYLSWVYQLNGQLDIGALETAVDEVVRRFEILRTTFEPRNGTLEQVVRPFSPGVLTVIDLNTGSKREGIVAAHDCVCARYLSLSPHETPEFQVLLYRIAPKTSVLAIFVGEALVDSDSGEFVMAEISTLYAGILNAALPTKTGHRSFFDYLLSHPVSAETIRRCREYWSRQARTAAMLEGWPTEPTSEEPVAARGSFSLDRDGWDAALGRIRAAKTTPYVYVLSCLQLALARVAGVRRSLVHAIATSRMDPEAQLLIGNFQSVIRLASVVGPTDQLSDVISRTSIEVAEALFHSDIPAPLTEDHDLELSRGGESVGLEYDKDDRLKSVGLPNGIDQLYAYDEAGQTSAIWGSFARLDLPESLESTTYDKANELVKREGQALEYDKNGALVDDGPNQYSWNACGQLAGIEGEHEARFGYDPFGRRTEKTFGEASTGVLFDGANAVQETEKGEEAVNYLTGIGIDQLFTRTAEGNTSSYLTDSLGSVLALTDAKVTKRPRTVTIRLEPLWQPVNRVTTHFSSPVAKAMKTVYNSIDCVTTAPTMRPSLQGIRAALTVAA